MDQAELLVERQGAVAIATLNRPEHANSLTARMAYELIALFEQANRDDTIKAIVLTGAGDAFCAGADAANNEDDQRYDEALARRFPNGAMMGRWSILVGTAHACRKPMLAAVNGLAAGMGLSLALAADLRLAAPEARFVSALLQRGAVPDQASTFHLPRLLGNARALEVLLTGDPLDATEADRIGLVNRTVPAADLVPATLALAHRIAAYPAAAIELTRKLVYDQMREGLPQQLQAEAMTLPLIAQASEPQDEAPTSRRAVRFRGR
ncbi:MAG: enoyl-CoA hydratase-related protein [Chloroflexi bacterium]|nr:enoyl-CoA hydratase-related protein [Chloroflexota bacterium]